MTWTTEVPKKEGWYWWRVGNESPSFSPIKLWESGGKMYSGSRFDRWPAEQHRGQWYSEPLVEPPPRAQELAKAAT